MPAQGGRPLLLHAATPACRTRACSTRRRRSTAEPRVLLDPNTLVDRRHRRPRRPGASATTASCSPTASPRPARTGTSGRSATSPPARTCADHLKWIKFSGASWTQGRQGLLLQPLPRAEAGRGPQGRQLLPEALLPQARHAAGRRRARLRAARPQGVAASTASVTDDGRYLDHHRLARGPTPSTASSTRTSTRARRASRST